MSVVEQSAAEHFAGRSSAAEPSGRDAVEEFRDRSPLASRYARIQRRILGTKSRFTPRRLH
jgi:hypothetical protein